MKTSVACSPSVEARKGIAFRVGDWVWFDVRRDAETHRAVPRTGTGVVVRDLTRNRAESCDYEVETDGHGRLCFRRGELTPWH